MPRIFDNIEHPLLPALQETLKRSYRADFCVGYFNLRGWRFIDTLMDSWKGAPDECCRLLVGMQRQDSEELCDLLSVHRKQTGMDLQTAKRFGRQLAENFRKQLLWGAPTNEDEAGLRRLARQLREKKVIVKLFLQHPLHAKLYLLFRKNDCDTPLVGYLGSSNLTMPGLSEQGELNIDVLDSDASAKLAGWFEDRWNDRFNIDISEDLIDIIENSWAREDLIPPYHIYIKMAYHLSQEARSGLSEFKIPIDIASKLFEFQIAAVKISAHHLMHRHGLLLGDVVGLGKTLMATAVARVLQEDGFETLIICPPNLVAMWEGYREDYRLFARTVSMGQVEKILPELKPFRLVIIDESHNLRNREGKRYQAIKDYISTRNSRCILLTATPYNKSFLDLSNQLRLFVPDDHDIGIRPEALLRRMTETEFIRQHQCSVRSLAAFEKSDNADDWRELMRLYLVRRTRTFIQQNYALAQCSCGSSFKGYPDSCPACGKPLTGKERRYLTMPDGTPTYFPERLPRTVRFSLNDKNSTDQYARLYSKRVVDLINDLFLPRYGLGNYLIATPTSAPTQAEARQMQDLSRAGKRLMGFCRTNLFKRLESSGAAFLLSVSRHILRNYIYLYALENQKPVPLGPQDAVLLDDRVYDEDSDTGDLFAESGERATENPSFSIPTTEKEYRKRAAEVYEQYAAQFRSRFSWLRADLFVDDLGKQLHHDARTLIDILALSGEWKPENDAKLSFLQELLVESHPTEKVIVFSQFADTIRYLSMHLKLRGVESLEGVTGDTPDPTAVAWRFSPRSNGKTISKDNELRIVLATDVLSEGQNLQDCAIVVNFDLPWAIIRLIQRAGRVDRIGQQAPTISCYTFLPAEGVERIIQLRARIRQRLKENSEVVGTDEAFFEDDNCNESISDLYNEKAGILDGDGESEVDLASYAYQIWKNATDAQPELRRTIEQMQDVVFSTRLHAATISRPEGVLLYAKTGEGNDALAYVDNRGVSITESQFEILKIAACAPDCPGQPRNENHHRLVAAGIEHIMKEEKRIGGQLGRPTGARFRCYERLKNYANAIKGTMFETTELLKAIDEIYRYPLRPAATDKINRQLRNGIQDMQLADLILSMREEERLCIVDEAEQTQEPRIICSLGMFEKSTLH